MKYLLFPFLLHINPQQMFVELLILFLRLHTDLAGNKHRRGLAYFKSQVKCFKIIAIKYFYVQVC